MKKILFIFISLVSFSSLASECYVGEIRMFAGNFAPRGWALAQGQLLPVTSNDALFSLYGTIYGGDGRTTFALPDLRGRVAIQQGNGPGLSSYRLGSRGGRNSVTLQEFNLPSHSHTIPTINEKQVIASSPTFKGKRSKKDGDVEMFSPGAANIVETTSVGGGQPLNIEEPTLGINHIVCLYGIYPSRS